MDQLAQVPDSVVSKTAETALQYGLAGVVIVVLVGATWYLARSLLQCMNASLDRQTGLITVVEAQKNAGEKVADAMEGQQRRLEELEKTIARLAETVARLSERLAAMGQRP